MKKIIAVVLFAIMSTALFASAGGKVISVAMNPPNPNFGDLVQITVTYCAQLYNSEYIAVAISSSPTKSSADLSNNGQIFVVSVQGVDVATDLPDGGNPGGPIGWQANANPNGGTSDCQDCQPQNGKTFTNVYSVHIPPATDFPGCNTTQLYIHVALKDANMNAPDWVAAGDTGACNSEPSPVSWTMGTMAKGFTMSKTTSGEVQAQNDLLLYSINYSYWNGQLTLTDAIPGGGDLQLVSFGPAGITGGMVTGPAVGATAGTFSWTLPDRTGQPGAASGTVWMLYKELKNPPTMGTNYANSAQGTMTGLSPQNASANCVVGQAAITITNSQSAPNPNYGDIVTYYLTYNVNGMQLAAFQSFDDLALGVYGSMSGETGAPPTGWQFVPQNGVNGQWTISDACNTGDRVITGQVNTASTYPGLLYQGITGNQLCSGIIQGEAYINPGTNEGADALMYIRNDGLVGGKAYSLLISVDKNIGGYTGGHIEFQACTPSCVWPTPTIIGPDPQITANQWWAMKVWIDPANQYHFQAKAWPRGSPEPAGYQIDWTDPNGAAEGMDCNNGAAWKAGFGEEGGDVAGVWTQDSYNNFQIYNPRVSANTIVWDTIPNSVAGTSDGSIIYAGQQGPYPYVGNAQVAKWNLGNISNEGGTFTWWGTVNTCATVTNQAFINGASAAVAQLSNITIMQPVCVSSTFTPSFTPTPTVTMTYMTPGGTNTSTPTFTTTFTISPTFTPTLSSTPSFTATIYNSYVPSASFTPTATPTPSFTGTLSAGSATNTPTFTPTATITLTISGGSATSTFTATITATAVTYYPDAVTIVSAVSSQGNCYVAGQNLTITINATIGSAWATMYGLVVGSSGALVYNIDAGEPDDCLWGLTGAAGNAPNNISPWQSNANMAAGGAGGSSVTNYQMIVPVPASYAGIGPKTFYVIIGNSSSQLTLGQYYSSYFIQTSLTLPECGAGTATYTPTFTPTPTLTATVNLTPQPTCNMTATPVFTVQATYNNGHGANNTVIIDVTSDSDFTVPPVVVVHPYGESLSKPALTLTTVKFPGPPAFYRVIMPQEDGYGDIQSIVVTGTDTCGRTGVSNGTYTKKSITGGRDTWPYHNVFNPDRHERVRIVYNVYGPDMVHIKVYSRSGGMVQNICTCAQDGSRKQDETSWYGMNDDNRAVASGIYYVVIETSYYTDRIKVAVVR